MYCPACGASNSEDAIACSQCGQILVSTSSAGAISDVPTPNSFDNGNNASTFDALNWMEGSGAHPNVPGAHQRGPASTTSETETPVPGEGSKVPASGRIRGRSAKKALEQRKSSPAPASAPAPREAGEPRAKAGAGTTRPGRDVPLRGHVKLVVEQGKILGEQYLLSDRRTLIGRYDAGTGHCPDIDLSAQDADYVHRRHAELVFDETGYTLTAHDLGGRNRCYVNNEPVPKKGVTEMGLGDKLRVGRVVMRLMVALEVTEHGD